MLSVRDLVKVYPGPVTALQGVSLDIGEGMFGLLGPNGAGKSTFMKILAGVLEPTSGKVTLDGQDVLSDPQRIWSRLGYLPQDFGFFPHLSGEAMLAYLLELKGVESGKAAKTLARELLGRVNLSHAAHRRVKDYSGGMRQRLGIAQAVAGDPRLIIVDEPTAGLDPEERHRFYRLLAELAEHRIVLLSTHIVEDVAVLCPRFAVIRSGRLVALTTPSEARRSLDGSIFEGDVAADALPTLARERRVTQAILVEGRNRVRIHEPSRLCPPGFEPTTATLEDAYLVLMYGEVIGTQGVKAVTGASGNGGPSTSSSVAPVWRRPNHGDGAMTLRRLLLITRGELAFNARRPLFYVLLAIVALLIWGVSAGHVTIVSSGDSTVGGHKAFLTSEFAVARLYIAIAAILHAFFFAIAGGMSIIRDDEAKVGEILHATPLTPGEYVWGKFMGALVTIVAMLAVQTVITLVLYHGLPNGDMIETRGPFALANYLRPTLFLVLPYALFVTGGSFAIGAWTRKPVLVFFLPIAFTLIEAFFLWNWSPSWLPLSVNHLLQWVDPSGMRWLQEMWLKTDRGTAFYNVQPIGYDPAFLMSRLVLIAIGFGAVALVARHFAATIRSSGKVTTPAKTTTAVVAPAPLATPEPIVGGVSLGATLAALKMRSRTPSFFAATLAVARAEARELRSQPGLYLFVPIILMQVIGTALVSLGTFDTPLLLTPGTLAENSMGQLIGYMALLLLFYTVESLERERATRFAAIHSSLPVPTGAMLAGKAIALGIVGAIVTVAALLGCLVAVMVQGKVGFSFTPFILLWGVLLVPSFIAWTTFVMATYSVTKNRYTSYAVGVGVFALSVYLLLSGKLNWLDNWSLWNVVKWSDISVLEVDRTALVLSRLFYLAVAVMLARVATRHFPRRERDAVNTIHRLRFSSLWRSGMRALPTLLLPLVTGAFLWKQIDHGPNGAAAKKTVKDYWKKNLSTWKDARAPAIGDVNMDVAIEPAERRWRVKGTYLIVNKSDTVVHWLPVSVGLGWHDLAWTIDGVKTTPDTASHLNVFKLATPLAAGDSLRLGFSYVGQQTGALKNGGAGMTFVVPSGVVMTNFDPRWFPFVGYVESIGQDDDNKYEPKEYADDFWKGITPPGFGSSLPMTVTTRITVPKDFEANGVGERMSDDVHGDTRTVVWHTDHPVMAFNIVAGRWKVRRGTGTALYYDPKHEYNAAEIADALDQARKYYGQWFGEFPWRELKISEFPALATYAQGFPTNITFSESIGFLTKSEPKTYLAFLVTAHEIAHQWWGNMLLPGEGPSGNLLSEGMAHFSTTLLIEQVKGFRGALEFRKRIESRYNDNRRVDAERKLYRLDGSKDGDQTVLYDKGGWVFWMLARRMGRENALHGMRDFIAKYTNNPDHAVLHDFTEHMRTYAPDTASYDDFIKQWMDTVVVPEYRVTDAKTVKQGSDWVTTATVENIGTGRMPMEAAATIGDRFPDDDATAAKKAKATAYQDSRIPLTLGAKEKQQITIRSTFEPDKVIVDPDVTVLQLRRKLAESSVSK